MRDLREAAGMRVDIRTHAIYEGLYFNASMGYRIVPIAE
jgi:hypothetical protein